MVDLIVSGHSSLNLKADPPKVRVGPGQRVKFFQEPLHLLSDTRGQAIERLVAEVLDNPTRTYEPGEWCPNYSVTAPNHLEVVEVADPNYRQLVVHDETFLSTILARAENAAGTVYWAACLAVKFDGEVGGNAVGVNTGWDGTDRAERESAELRSADIEQRLRDTPGIDETTEDGFYVGTLARHAYPSGAEVPESLLTVLFYLVDAAKQGPARLARVFAGNRLNSQDRRGFLLNDTFRWWLRENGLRIPGEITDAVLDNADPAFWLPRAAGPAEPDGLAAPAVRNAAELAALQPDQPVQVVVTPDGLLLVGGDHPADVIEYVAGRDHAVAAVVRRGVDQGAHLVVADCPAAWQGAVYAAFGELGAQVWFDVPPDAVVHVGLEHWDWDDLAARNRAALADLGIGRETPFLADSLVVLLTPLEHFTDGHRDRVRDGGDGTYEGVFRNNILTGYDVTGCPPDRRAMFAENLELAGIPREKLIFTD